MPLATGSVNLAAVTLGWGSWTTDSAPLRVAGAASSGGCPRRRESIAATVDPEDAGVRPGVAVIHSVKVPTSGPALRTLLVGVARRRES